ncbi:MAG: hypothetical protein V7607_3172 [Solirubrobacteraceae bacterium]
MSREREVLERRAASDAAVAREARAELRDVLEHRAAAAIPPGLDPLVRALIVAGRAVGVEASAARVDGLLRRPEPADVYAAAARLRVPVRPVELPGRWWAERGLPLIVVPEHGSAEALVAGRGGYRIVGNRERPDRLVDAEVAQLLGGKAWALTPRLPDGGAGWRDVLRLAVMGGRSDVGTIAFAVVALALLGTALPLATTFVVGQVIPKAQTSALGAPAAALAAMAVAVLACTVVQGLAVLRLAGRADAAVQAAVFDRVFHLPVSFFRTRSSGRLAREVLAIDDIRDLVSSAVVAGVAAGPLALSSLALILAIAPELGAGPVLVVVLGALLAVHRARESVRSQRTMVAERSRLNGVLLGLLTGIPKLRVAGAEQRMGARWAAGYARQQAAQRRSADANADIAVIFSCLAAAATLALVASARLIGGHVAAAEFVGLTAALGQLIAATTLIVPAVSQLLSVLPLYESAKPLLSERVEVSEYAADPGELQGHLELTGVTFSYRADQAPALVDVSLRAAPGELVAIAGPSGAGKSTLLRLMLGFEQPARGSVLYDHRDLSSLDVEAVRRQVGVVIQSAQLSAGSILQNIVGVLPFTEEQAWEAAERAGVADDIRAMPMGMQTIVSEGGATFSGGQRQRLMIARALLRGPRILIFDEATSALDNETQATVTKSLAELGATRIVIAHRLSTIQRADRIYVLDRGRVVESGGYRELLESDGLFTRLARRQLTAA